MKYLKKYAIISTSLLLSYPVPPEEEGGRIKPSSNICTRKGTASQRHSVRSKTFLILFCDDLRSRGIPQQRTNLPNNKTFQFSFRWQMSEMDSSRKSCIWIGSIHQETKWRSLCCILSLIRDTVRSAEICVLTTRSKIRWNAESPPIPREEFDVESAAWATHRPWAPRLHGIRIANGGELDEVIMVGRIPCNYFLSLKKKKERVESCVPKHLTVI